MTTTQLRQRISRRLQRLSAQRLKMADEFMAYLQECENNAETNELLAIPGFKASLRRAEKHAAKGKTVSLAKVRRHV